jgi:hypothetical protein
MSTSFGSLKKKTEDGLKSTGVDRYGRDSSGNKSCDKCHKSFKPAKFTPYQKYCPDCAAGGINAAKSKVKSGSAWIRTQCNKCGCNIRIRPDTMTALCNDHCGESERRIRMQFVQDKLDKTLGNVSQQYVFINSIPDYECLKKLTEEQINEYKQLVEKFTFGAIKSYPLRLELVYLWLLARGFKLTKGLSLLKEYGDNGNRFTVNLLSPENGMFGFCVSYMVSERVKEGKKEGFISKRESDIIVIPSNLKRIDNLPTDLVDDIHLLLELNYAKRVEERAVD